MNIYAIPPLVSALLFGWAGLFVYFKDTKKWVNRLFALICLTTVFWQGTWFVLFQFPHPKLILPLIKLGYTDIIFIPIAIYHFAVSFLNAEKDKRFLLPAYLVGLFLVIMLHASDFYISGYYKYFFGFYPKAGLVLHPPYLLFLTALVGRGIYLLFLSTREPSLPKAIYRQRQLLLIAFCIYTMASVDFLVNYGVEFYPFGVIFILIALGIIGYAVVSYQLMDIRTVIHKTAAWITASSAIVVPVAGLFYFGHRWIGSLSPLQLSLFATGMGLLLIPYARVLLPLIDQFFERRKYDLKTVLQEFIRETSTLKTPTELIAAFQSTIKTVLYPETVSLILFDIRSEEIKPVPFFEISPAFSIASHTAFLKGLEKSDAVLDAERMAFNPMYDSVKEAAGRYLLATDAKVVVPLIHDKKLFGVIHLGPKKNLQPYTQDEIDFLVNLKIEGSIALSNSLLYADVRQLSEELEARVEERTRQLEASYEKLKELDRLKSRFFANISHEFRTPITLLMGPTEMLLRRELGAITENQEKYLQVIHTHSARLLRLINNLLNLSKADAGETKLSLQRGNFIALVRKTVNSIVPVAEKKGIRLAFSGDETIPAFLYDPEKMEDVILNLLSNALKFTEEGEIRVSCEMQWDNVLVKVSDTGIGIPNASIPKLFDRFFQVDTAASRVGAGTGIGLSLVKEWVELHGGRVWVESEEGQGSTFFFTIPIRLGEVVGVPVGVERRMEVRSGLAVSFVETQVGLNRGKEAEAWEKALFREGAEKILLVDDNADMLHFMADQLRDDYNLLFARDGEEGIQMARREQPDLIISDIMMPVKDGYQLCRELKGDSQTSTIPIIFLTAKGALSDKIEGLEQGADDYLTKPFNKEELCARVLTLLHKRRLQKEITEKNRQLAEALERLKRVGRDLAHTEKMDALGLLTAGIAHEINNPLSYAKGSLTAAQNLFDKVKDDKGAWEMGPHDELVNEISACLDTVQNGLLRSETIVRNLAFFAQKDDPLQRVNLSVCLDATLALTRHEWSPRITVHRNYGTVAPVEGFSGQINQALLNILQNAMQAIDNQGEIFIAMHQGEEGVILSIRDTGRGIAESDLPRVFEPFFTTKEVGKGTGLGLAITYKIIVETHHGKIDVKSQKGAGTEIIITLPITQPTAESRQ